jgi:NAD(P)-dependent dehydrogenase (short-subunit alcohol dehydrogenase family)
MAVEHVTTKTMTRRTALVTGANRGIGLEVSRELLRSGYRVVATTRDEANLEPMVRELGRDGDVLGELIEVTSEASVAACAARLEARAVDVDVLVNNAGVYPPGAFFSTSSEVLRSTFETNFWGPVWTCRAWAPAMGQRGFGRIVNVSSGAGSLAEGLDGPAAYALSKAAINALTVRLAREISGDVKVNAVCPGWVRTRMGGMIAPRSVRQGADTIVWLATLDASGPTGGFFRDRQLIPW